MRSTVAARSIVPPANNNRSPSQVGQLDLAVGSAETDVGHLRDHVRAGARNVPGVYIMRNAHGVVLYVGKSTQIRARLLSYFRLPWPEHRHARMLRETASIEWEEQPSEFAALLREVRLIRSHLPNYNVRSARPLDKWWVITIGDGPAPRLRVQRASAAFRARGPSSRNGPANPTVIGPFRSRAPLKEALRVLNDAFGLRDCSERVRMIMRDTTDLFEGSANPQLIRTPQCHRYETRRCLGPCVGACSAAEYRVQLMRAKAVLAGHDTTPQTNLVKEMGVASAALSYERAGWLRDRLAALQELEFQLQRVRESLSGPSGVYRVTGRDGDDRLYLIRYGRVVQEARAADPSGAAAVYAAAARPVSTAMGISPQHLDEVLMVEQWFRTHPSEVAGSFAARDD